MAARDYQEWAVKALWAYFEEYTGNPVIVMPTGCHAKGHPILMHNGEIVPVEEIKVGDAVMGPDSLPRYVLALARGRQEMRRIVPNNGMPFVVNKDHKLLMRVTNQGASSNGKTYPWSHSRNEVVTIDQYENASDWFKHLRKLQRVSVEFGEKLQPLPAYFIGAMLGDGCLRAGIFNLTTMDPEIASYFTSTMESLGLVVTKRTKLNNVASSFSAADPCANRSTPNRVTKIFRDLGMQECLAWEKSIPAIYKIGSRQQRLELLAGLLDTDGHYDVKCNGFQYCTTSEQLAKDTLFVCHSLGFRGQVKKRASHCNGKQCRDAYVINITGSLDEIPTLLPRKKAWASAKQKDCLVTGFKTEKLAEDDYYGFTLSGDHLYLDSQFIIHHNTGKSHVIADFIKSAMMKFPRTRCLVLTHVKELIAQNHAKFLETWPTAPSGIFSAGLNKKQFNMPVTFGGIGSVAKKAGLFGHIDFVIVDECDLVSPDSTTMYPKFISDLKKKNPHVKLIGLTATPWRSGFGKITDEGGLFTDIPVDMGSVEAFNWFLSEGYLLPLIPKKTDLQLDVSGVGMRGGDYIQSDLQLAVDKREITIKALEETIALGEHRKSWLIFASGIDHAKNIAHMLTEMGVPCKAVYSGMTESRDEIIRDLKSGKLRAVVNNNVLTTGFDHPSLDMIVILRPSGSSRLWVQMLGRGTRPLYSKGYDLTTKEGRLEAIDESAKQNCLVLDFANNTKKLGPINDPVLPRKKGEKGGEAPVKLCTACGVWNHASARNCCSCGHEFVFVTKLKVEASTTELIKKVAPVEFPIVEVFQVDHITYTLHQKFDKPKSVKVTYYCGFRSFTEYVCIEHSNHARFRAVQWLKQRGANPGSQNISAEDVLLKVNEFPVTTHLSVWLNKDGGKYPQIQDYCFDGTAFGKVAAPVDKEPIRVTVEKATNFKAPAPKSTTLMWEENKPPTE